MAEEDEAGDVVDAGALYYEHISECFCFDIVEQGVVSRYLHRFPRRQNAHELQAVQIPEQDLTV